MTDSTPTPAATGPVTLDDVRAALADTDPSTTNASALRKLIGRGSLSTIQRHLDTIRAEGVQQPLEVGSTAPDAPRDLIAAVWSHAWTAAQARTAAALAEAQAEQARTAAALAVAQADAAAAQAEADEAGQELAALRAALADAQQALTMEQTQHAAGLKALRDEMDRIVSQITKQDSQGRLDV
jgi:hypothetical protein